MNSVTVHEQLPSRQRRRLFTAGQQRSSHSCQLYPPVSNGDITRLLCRSGLRYVREDCADAAGLAPGAAAGPAQLGQRSMRAAVSGISIGIGVLLLVLLILMAVMTYRSWLLKKKLGAAASDDGQLDPDAEQPPKAAWLQHRRRRRLRRLLHLKQNHVHFSDQVDVTEIPSQSELSSGTSSSVAGGGGASGRYPRRDSPYVRPAYGSR